MGMDKATTSFQPAFIFQRRASANILTFCYYYKCQMGRPSRSMDWDLFVR